MIAVETRDDPYKVAQIPLIGRDQYGDYEIAASLFIDVIGKDYWLSIVGDEGVVWASRFYRNELAKIYPEEMCIWREGMHLFLASANSGPVRIRLNYVDWDIAWTVQDMAAWHRAFER